MMQHGGHSLGSSELNIFQGIVSSLLGSIVIGASALIKLWLWWVFVRYFYLSLTKIFKS